VKLGWGLNGYACAVVGTITNGNVPKRGLERF
jgi:hypothetical protein